MSDHDYHIIACYEGESTDYNIIYNVSAKLAYGFADDGFEGMVNGIEYVWRYIIMNIVKSMYSKPGILFI